MFLISFFVSALLALANLIWCFAGNDEYLIYNIVLCVVFTFNSITNYLLVNMQEKIKLYEKFFAYIKTLEPELQKIEDNETKKSNDFYSH